MAKQTYENGLFITFEGPEGSGKTTQMQLIADRLREQEYEVVTTREPGGTPLGEAVRKLLLTFRDEDILPEAELLLFSAARVQHVRKVILPVLKRGGIVLCDRFIDSTTAYQGYARGLDLNVIDDMNAFAVCGRFPDLTIVLDLSVEDGIRRLSGRYQGQQVDDRFESAGHTFHSCVREGFLDIARKHPGRVRVIDANRPVELVQADLWWEIYHALN